MEVMLNWPLYEEETDEEGQVVIFTPAKWSLRDAASLLTAVDRTARLALGEVTERTHATGEATGSVVHIYMPENGRASAAGDEDGLS